MAKILIVDDDPDFVEITRLILTSGGYQVVSAANAKQALAQVSSEQPDLLLLDVMMEGVLDGVHVAHTLAEESRYKLPIIMISSISDSSMAGMFPSDEYLPIDAWISKPVQPKDLLKRVARLIEQPLN